MKTRILSIFALLLMAVTGAWADDTYTVQFKANGNTKTVENVVLPYQFRCNYQSENGELDQIIKELYGLSAGYCLGLINPCSNENVTCGVSGYDDYITISAPFEGTATVTGTYDLNDDDGNMLDYSLEISIPGYVNPKVNVTGVSLSETTASMTVGGETLTLTATVAPANATNKTVTWTTSDASVATVANGVVTAVAAGTATITATATNGTADTSDDQTATCTVTVSNPTVTANEGATGEYWATYYNGTTSFTADENTTVFQAALSGSSLTLTVVPNREIPATKAVILKSSSATITLTPASTTETLEGNQLVGTATAITNPGNAYVLNKTVTNGVGFYKLSSTGTIGANKAYLTYSGASQARSFFGFDETTGIEMPTAEVIDADAVVYDLQGRRVAQPTKGLYIVNGKKVIIK